MSQPLVKPSEGTVQHWGSCPSLLSQMLLMQSSDFPSIPPSSAPCFGIYPCSELDVKPLFYRILRKSPFRFSAWVIFLVGKDFAAVCSVPKSWHPVVIPWAGSRLFLAKERGCRDDHPALTPSLEGEFCQDPCRESQAPEEGGSGAIPTTQGESVWQMKNFFFFHHS